MAYSGFDERRTMRDLLIAWKRHPDERPLDVLRARKRARGERRV